MEPNYLHYSPLFPNPVLCVSDISSRLIRTIPSRLPSFNSSILWLRETWEWQYTSFYFNSLQLCHLILIAVGLTLLRISLTNFFFQRCLKNFSERNKYKYAESSWRLMFYSMTSACSVYLCVIAEEQFFFYPSGNLKNWVPGYPVKPIIYWLYMFEAGYYTQGIYATFFLDVKKKDFVVQLTHHFVALMLIVLSIGSRYQEGGMIVFLLHDTGDVVFEIAKILTFFKLQNACLNKVLQTLSHIALALFVLQWCFLRLYWFPTKFLHLQLCVLHVLICKNYPFHTAFSLLAITLQSMHIYWFVFILKAVIKAIKGGGLKDSREKY